MQHLFSPAGEAALAATMALQPLLAFDFDGTLAPIVAMPDDARVSGAMARRLQALASKLPLAVVSGRAVEDLRTRLSFEPHYLIGNHGAEDPSAPRADSAGLLDGMRGRLGRHAASLTAAGVTLEDKGQSIALHYRLARDRTLAHAVATYFARTLEPGLRAFGGKLVMNFVSGGAPDKAGAVATLVERSGVRAAVFLGDDVNDEPVFERAEPGWLTVKVGRDEPVSAAMYYLDGVGEVAEMLDRMLGLLGIVAEPAAGSALKATLPG